MATTIREPFGRSRPKSKFIVVVGRLFTRSSLLTASPARTKAIQGVPCRGSKERLLAKARSPSTDRTFSPPLRRRRQVRTSGGTRSAAIFPRAKDGGKRRVCL